MRITELLRQCVDEGMPHEEAVRRVVKVVSADPELIREFWDAYGRGTVSRVLTRMSSEGNGKSYGPQQRIPRTVGGPSLPPSWRDRLRDDPSRALSIELPVRGNLVRIRDLTTTDIEYIEDQYRGIAQIATARGERWGSIRRKMEHGETVGQAVDAGRVRLADLLATGFSEPLEAGA